MVAQQSLTLADFHVFVPSRSLTKVNAFTDVLRHQNHAMKLRGLMLSLTTLFKPGLSRPELKLSQRAQIDQSICRLFKDYWRKREVDMASFLLNYLLLTNEYMASSGSSTTHKPLPSTVQIVRATLRRSWSDDMVPLLCSEEFQQFLQQSGPSDLRLKLSSHWVFADLVYRLDKEREQSERTPYLEIERSCTEIDCLVGIPSKLLWIYHCATSQSQEPPMLIDDHCYLYHELLQLQPTIPDRVDLSHREQILIKDTSQAYVYAAQLYVLCRTER